MPKVEVYECNHCGEIYLSLSEYKEHALATLRGSASVINDFYNDLPELKISVTVYNDAPFGNHRCLGVEDLEGTK